MIPPKDCIIGKDGLKLSKFSKYLLCQKVAQACPAEDSFRQMIIHLMVGRESMSMSIGTMSCPIESRFERTVDEGITTGNPDTRLQARAIRSPLMMKLVIIRASQEI